MFNEVRTLLLNVDGTVGYPAGLAAEHIPAEYRAVELPSSLKSLRRELFGHDPDLTGLNYRLRQFAAILHAPDIEPYTLAGDSRVTYWPADDVCFHLPLGLVVEPLTGTTMVSLLGAVPLSGSGRLWQSWLVTAVDDDLIDVVPEQSTALPITVPVVRNDNLSDPIALPGLTTTAFRLGGGTVTAGTRFRLNICARHATRLAELPGRLDPLLTAGTSRELFGEGFGDYGVFRDWWLSSDQLTYKLGGLLLALARRTADIRRRR